MNWPDFFSNLAATLVGIAVGVPLALWISRRTAADEGSSRRQAEREEIDYALDVLQAALRDNVPKIQRMLDLLDKNELLLDPGFDISAWDVIQRSLTSEWHDTEARRKIAHHFNRLAGLSKLNERLVELTIGVNSALGGALQTRAKLLSTNHAIGRELRDEAQQLANALDANRKSLGGPYARRALTV